MSYPFRRGAAGALAARPDTTGWAQLPSSDGHFLVHYPPGVDAGDASAAAAGFESAYATEVGGWGFPAPLPDGDPLIDVYVEDAGDHLGEAHHDDPAAPTTSGYVVIDPSSVHDAATAAHELFHLIQYAIYAHGAKFLVEGSAEWAGANVAHTTTWLFSYWAAPEQSLECAPGSACAPSPDEDRSYSRWLFWDYLSERYGPGIVAQVLGRAGDLAAGTDAGMDLQAVDDVLVAHGSSLAEAFDGFSAANADGSYAFSGLAGSGQRPRPALATYTGVTNATLPDRVLGVDHLAAVYVSLSSGDPRYSSAGCGVATLHLSVELPPGAGSRPAVADGAGLHPLAGNGDTAGVDLPWTTCQGSSALLALPNASRSLDGARFLVHASVAVAPPTPRAGTAAPRIGLSLAKRPKLDRKRPFLRFRVRSSGAGILQVLLRSRYVRGSYGLHRGLNRLRLRLPRHLRAGDNQFVVTVYSTTGARGRTLRRHLTIGFAGGAYNHGRVL